MSEPAWYRDPTARFDERFWDGNAWTEHVRSGGDQRVDPLVNAAAHVRFDRLDPHDRIVEDIERVLGRAGDPSREHASVSFERDTEEGGRGDAVPSDAREVDVEVPRTAAQRHADALTIASITMALVAVGMAFVPVAGIVAVLAGATAAAVALIARRRAEASEGNVERAVDAALFSVLATAAGGANVLVSLHLIASGDVAAAVACTLEASATSCMSDLARHAWTVVTHSLTRS